MNYLTDLQEPNIEDNIFHYTHNGNLRLKSIGCVGLMQVV